MLPDLKTQLIVRNGKTYRKLGFEEYPVEGEFAAIPERIMEGIHGFVENGRPTGDFLQAVLSNDYVGAICRADNECAKFHLPIAHLIYNYAPAPCWGSRENVKAWIALGGLPGWEAEQARLREQQEGANALPAV